MKTLEDNSSARLIFVHVLMSREKEKEADRGKKISQVRFTFFTGKNGRVARTQVKHQTQSFLLAPPTTGFSVRVFAVPWSTKKDKTTLTR